MINRLIERYPFIADYFGSSGEFSLRKKIAGGFGWSFISKTSLGLAGIILSALLARILSPGDLGMYFIAMNVVGIIATIGLFGFSNAAVKLVAAALVDQPGRLRSIIRSILVLGSTGSLVGALFLALGGGNWLGSHVFHSPEIGAISILLAILVVVTNVQTLAAEIFRGFQDFRWASLLGGQQALTRLLTLFLFTVAWLFFSRISLTQVVVLSLIGNAATLLLGLILLWRSVAALGPEKGSNPSLSQEIFPLAIPLWISSLAFLLLNQADIFMLGTLRSEQEVAVYGIALRLAQLISVPLFMFNAVLPPIIAKLYIQGEKKQLERVLRIAASLAFIFSVLCTILFMVFGGDLLTLLFGKTYVQAYWLLIILSLGQVVNVATGSCGMLLMMSGYHKQYMTITLVNGGFCIVLLYLLIPQVGSLGAAIAVTLDIILFMGMAAFYAWYRTDIRTWPFSPIGIVRQARKGFK